LWIASTVKEPLPEEIKQLENFYKTLYGKTDLAFPQNYPSGCLLGCVEVVDVLPQEEYRIQHPNGESESPYVFVCENPHELFFKFPNKGQHKICKFLDVSYFYLVVYLFISLAQINWILQSIRLPKNRCGFDVPVKTTVINCCYKNLFVKKICCGIYLKFID
jgi:hypothetical protein